MEQCKYEAEIRRIVRILDGNARGGLVRDMIEVRKEQNDMCVSISDLKDTAELQARAISGFNQYQNSQEVLNEYKNEHRKEKNKWLMLIITQSIGIIGLILTLILR
jgi:hypothetical protein